MTACVLITETRSGRSTSFSPALYLFYGIKNQKNVSYVPIIIQHYKDRVAQEAPLQSIHQNESTEFIMPYHQSTPSGNGERNGTQRHCKSIMHALYVADAVGEKAHLGPKQVKKSIL